MRRKKVGIQLITVQLDEIDGESNTVNNRVVIPVEVLDAKEQVALIYHTLSPDIGAIQKVIAKNENLDVDLINISELSIDLMNSLKDKYNGLILYQLPSTTNKINANLLTAIYSSELPTMHLVGKQVNINQFISLNPGIAIKGNRSGMVNYTTGGLNSNFSLFNLPKESASIISEYPPVQAPLLASMFLKVKVQLFFFRKSETFNRKFRCGLLLSLMARTPYM